MKKQQSGFTMIELIMVIVILGILAAFALPKFVDLGGDARRATVQAALGSIKSASAMAHASFLAQNVAVAETGQSVKVEGGNVALKYGYPAATAIAEAAGITASDFAIPTTVASPVTLSAKGAVDGTKCGVVYTEASYDADKKTLTPPIIALTADMTGC
ncbi:type II secretion system protein [Stutzerimonas chloritidismutans]|uniref:type II secretion system protein n=1 Tax=Stutzerimonas chloritidismutans TaxID=203192 RepID=UPI00384C2E8D